MNESTTAAVDDCASDPMITGDDDKFHNRQSTVSSTVAAATPSTSVMPYAAVITPHRRARRRRCRTTISARPSLLRRRFDRAAVRLRLSVADANMLTDALPLIARRCGLVGPPRVTVRRHHATATSTRTARRRAELNNQSLDDAVSALGLHQPASDDERQVWQCATGDMELVTDADIVAARLERTDALAKHRLAQTLARTRLLQARVQVLTTAVVESMHAQQTQRVELDEDGSVRLHTARAVVTRDAFGDALCEHLLTRGVAEPRRAVVRVTEQVFMT
jgi:hypothetical protein